MAIEFPCPLCAKTVRAPRETAGKRGKCPHCQQSIYIPTPSDEIEILGFAPEDADAERREKALAQQSANLAKMLRADRETGSDAAIGRVAEREGAGGTEPISDVRLPVDMRVVVISYLKNMAAGDLSAAEEFAFEIRRDPRRAEEVFQQILMDEIPPAELSNVPRPVLNKLFEQAKKK